MSHVLVVAGLDPTAGAGLAADLEALGRLGVGGWPVAAAITAQGPAGVRGWSPVPEAMVLAQIEALLEGGGERPRAVKTGMLGTASLAAALCDRLSAADLRRVPATTSTGWLGRSLGGGCSWPSSPASVARSCQSEAPWATARSCIPPQTPSTGRPSRSAAPSSLSSEAVRSGTSRPQPWRRASP